MKKNKIFILLPSNSPTGPAKGAYAIANGIVNKFDVTIFYLKVGKGVHAYLDPKVKEVSLKGSRYNILKKINTYRKILKVYKPKSSLSICFSADFTNLFCKDLTHIISSVRSNLIGNYFYDYGVMGYILAFIHFKILRNFHEIISMSDSMQRQIKKFAGVKSKIVNNFIDEYSLEKYRIKNPQNKDRFSIAFLGSLSKRKQPQILLEIFKNLNSKNIFLNFIGDGPLMTNLKENIRKNKLKENVILHGFKNNPYPILAECDLLIMPSLSEGLSRAVLESLFLGLSCIVFDVDANSELSSQCKELYIVKSQEQLTNKIKEIINKRGKSLKRLNHLPQNFRKDYCINKISTILFDK